MQVDLELLKKCGLANLSKAKQESLLPTWVEAVELVVGEILSEGVSETQMEEFDELIQFEATTEGATLAEAVMHDWLSVNVPHYRAVAHEQTTKKLRELWNAAPGICAKLGVPFAASERLPIDEFLAEATGDK